MEKVASNPKLFWSVIASGASIAITLQYLYFKWRSSTFFERLHIPTPKSQMKDLGNLLQLHSRYSQQLRTWSLQLRTKVYGYYEGFEPVVVINDYDLMHKFITQESRPRRTFPLMREPTESNAYLFLNVGERLKRVRRCVDKSIGTSSLAERSMPQFNATFDEVFLAGDLADRVNIYSKIKSVMASCMFQLSFGKSLEEHNRETGLSLHKDFLVQRFDRAFGEFETGEVMLKLAWFVFPEFKGVWSALKSLKIWLYSSFKFEALADPLDWFHEQFIVTQYEKFLKEKSLDFYNPHAGAVSYLKIFLEDFCKEKGAASNTFMTSAEALSNTLLMFFAGYETTATTTAFACHVLVTRGDVKAKIAAEMSEHGVDERHLDAEKISALPYLDKFFKEVLRMYPVANSMVSRRCATPGGVVLEKDGKEYFVPANVNVVADVLSMHYDTSVWGEDAFTFNPDRYPLSNGNENKILTFGVGSRTCPGRKLALLQMKMFVVRLVLNYDFKECGKNMSKQPDDKRRAPFDTLDTKETLFNTPISGMDFILEKIKTN